MKAELKRQLNREKLEERVARSKDFEEEIFKKSAELLEKTLKVYVKLQKLRHRMMMWQTFGVLMFFIALVELVAIITLV